MRPSLGVIASENKKKADKREADKEKNAKAKQKSKNKSKKVDADADVEMHNEVMEEQTQVLLNDFEC